MDESIIQGEPIYYAHELDPDFDVVDILPLSDVHLGNPLFSKRHFLSTLSFLQRPNAYGILNGDLCESTLRSSKGEIYKQIGTPQDQRDQIAEWLYPYRHKLLGATDGNHEDRIWKEVGIRIVKDIADKLGIPYRPEGLIYKLSFGRGNNGHDNKPYVFWIYHTHGYGGARTKAAKAIKVERTASWIHCNLYVMSHDHVVNVAPDLYLVPDSRTRVDSNTGFRVGRVTAYRKMLVKSNAYLKWGGYSELGGFPPVDLTAPLVKMLTPKSLYWGELPDKPRQAVKVIT